MTDGVRLATATDAREIVQVLSRAFAQDPSIEWTIRADARRARGVELFFETVLERMTLPFGQVWVTGQAMRGAALWTPPGKWKLGLLEQVLMAPRMLRAFGWRRLGRVLDSMSLVQRHHPTKPHYYLQSIGVDPAHQGRGLGKALMAPVLARCDAEQVGAFLETAQVRNLPLYTSRGFQEFHRAPLAGGGPTMYFLWREPGAHVAQ